MLILQGQALNQRSARIAIQSAVPSGFRYSRVTSQPSILLQNQPRNPVAGGGRLIKSMTALESRYPLSVYSAYSVIHLRQLKRNSLPPIVLGELKPISIRIALWENCGSNLHVFRVTKRISGFYHHALELGGGGGGG
jgi:hypothetical protein